MADWKNFGAGAGMMRNQVMLRELLNAREQGQPCMVVAFPGGKGTANMVRLAEKHNIKVEHVA